MVLALKYCRSNKGQNMYSYYLKGTALLMSGALKICALVNKR